jgi:hypothetical protein
MKIWSVAMNNGDAELLAPPFSLLKSLMPAKSGTRNPFRDSDNDNSSISSKSSKSSKSSSKSTSTTPVPVQPFYPYPPHPYPYYGNTFTPFQQQTPAPTSPNHDRSSSVIEGYDPVEKLIEYLGWLTSRSPQQAEILFQCKEALISNGHTFNTIEKISDAQFERMNVPDGVVIELRSQLKRYKRKTLNHT